MLKQNQIERAASNAAYVAYQVLGLDSVSYSISFIDDPDLNYDGLLDMRSKSNDEEKGGLLDVLDVDENNRTAVIYLNLSKLTPFSTTVMPSAPLNTPEDVTLDENYRHLMKIFTVVYHEMRHLYQRRAVELYMLNQFIGGGINQLESKKKCELWKSELEGYVLGEGGINKKGDYATDLEADADDFAYYLSNRYPTKLTMLQTNKRIGMFKKKYDKRFDEIDMPGWK